MLTDKQFQDIGKNGITFELSKNGKYANIYKKGKFVDIDCYAVLREKYYS